MNYYISDLHFGHKNVIKLVGRPYACLEEMDEDLINKWNTRVKRNDTVYIVGDLVFENNDPELYLPRLSGRKILVVGNHDEKWLRNNAECAKYFTAIADYMTTIVGDRRITFCHYPMYEWKNSRKIGSNKVGYHIYGHIHNDTSDKYKPLFMLPHSFNAGADINGFMPVTFEELVKNNEEFKLIALKAECERARCLAASRYLHASTEREPFIVALDTLADGCATEKEKCAVYLASLISDRLIDISELEKSFSQEALEAINRV